MTDLEKVRKLLGELGVGYVMEHSGDVVTALKCEEGRAKIAGYTGFFTEFAFDRDGKFEGMGAWE